MALFMQGLPSLDHPTVTCVSSFINKLFSTCFRLTAQLSRKHMDPLYTPPHTHPVSLPDHPHPGPERCIYYNR